MKTFRELPDRFDLVITDMTIPYISGDKLAQEIKAIRSDVPAILCTGFSESINDYGENMNIEGFLMNPVDFSTMDEIIRKAMDEAKRKTHGRGSKGVSPGK